MVKNMPKLPTLFLLSNLCIGGSERKTVRAVNALHRRGLDVHLGYLNGPETLRSDIDPAVPVTCLERRGKFSWRTVLRLRDYVQRHGIARIVCVNLYPLLYVSALRLVMGRRAPSYLVTVNTTHFVSVKEASSMILYAPLMRRADGIVFGCDYQLGLWVDKYRLPRDKCTHLYNGVDENFYSPSVMGATASALRESFKLSDNDFVVGAVGQLRPEKHQRDLIVAVHRLREDGVQAVALIIGGGPEEAALKRLAGELEIEAHVRFLGEQRDVRPALTAMDVFVLTSLSETFSNAALEAMAMGKPVVLSDVGGAREMVWPGVNGYLFEKANVSDMVSVLRVLADDGSARQRMAECARRIAVDQFSFSRMVDEYEALFPSA